MSFVSFEILGKLTGANRVKTTVRFGAHNRTLTTASGRQDLSRVYQIAWAAAREADWDTPAACAVEIVAINSRLDCDATPKIILDGMIGAVYPDDRIVTALRVEKKCDRGEERYIVTVRACAPLEKPKPLRVMRWADVPDRYYARIAGVSLVYPDETIEATGCVPMQLASVPQAWRDRARKALAASQ